ncbi:MAG TPA: sigma-70 family RNA polymerase sigma factor [Solirubrobacteraceae bacterium]|nr:sigma-70 family RNA polymerase sigma factor [Solirubrobacteraceae bacterium]
MTPHVHAAAESARPACDLRALFNRCAAGDARARETIIVRFLPLARRLARGYEGRGEPIDDLCQAASIGLIKAVDRYSSDRGDQFPAYARPVIVGELKRHFRDTTWRVHVPRPVRERAGRVLRAEKELGTGSAKRAAIAKHIGVRREEVEEARLAMEAYSPKSLDASHVAPGGAALPLSDVIGADEPDYERVELSVGIRQTLLTLRPRDQKILLLRLAWELSQYEIADRVGISQMQVSRILRSACAGLVASCGLGVAARKGPRRWSRPTVVMTFEPATSRV